VTFLLDVNVLIPLIDTMHIAHERAQAWFAEVGSASWATCPITENGLIRIIGNHRYPNSPGSPAVIADILKTLCELPGHSFWPDDITVTGPDIDRTKILTAGQVTDTYLLALAKSRGGKLATFDRRLSTLAVEDGRSALHLIDG
jgi:uncharacterized protein